MRRFINMQPGLLPVRLQPRILADNGAKERLKIFDMPNCTVQWSFGVTALVA